MPATPTIAIDAPAAVASHGVSPTIERTKIGITGLAAYAVICASSSTKTSGNNVGWRAISANCSRNGAGRAFAAVGRSKFSRTNAVAVSAAASEPNAVKAKTRR